MAVIKAWKGETGLRLGTSLLVLVLCVQIMIAALSYCLNIMVDTLIEKVGEQMALFPIGQGHVMVYNGTGFNHTIQFPPLSP